MWKEALQPTRAFARNRNGETLLWHLPRTAFGLAVVFVRGGRDKVYLHWATVDRPDAASSEKTARHHRPRVVRPMTEKRVLRSFCRKSHRSTGVVCCTHSAAFTPSFWQMTHLGKPSRTGYPSGVATIANVSPCEA